MFMLFIGKEVILYYCLVVLVFFFINLNASVGEWYSPVFWSGVRIPRTDVVMLFFSKISRLAQDITSIKNKQTNT